MKKIVYVDTLNEIKLCLVEKKPNLIRAITVKTRNSIKKKL